MSQFSKPITKALWTFIHKNMPAFWAMNMSQPISRQFGFDRGTPVDRYYIEKFLLKNNALITGIAMEIAEPTYINKFGSKVKKTEVLHYSKDYPHTTIVGDLTQVAGLPSDYLDCFICTQTLMFIYDFKKAIEGINHLLKSGGAALVTVSGLSQISRYDADRWGDYWRFTPQGIKKSFEEVFGVNNVQVHSYGNVYTACALLRGLALEEIPKKKLDFEDQDYPLIITIIAKKQ